MACRDGGSCVDLLIIAMLSASIVIALAIGTAFAEPQQGAPLNRVGRAGTPSDLWSHHVAEASKRFSIPERWIRAVMEAESVGDTHAISPKGAMGLMQIMPATWEELRARYGLGDDPFEPRDNILAGTAYLREMLDRFGRNGFLAAYNAGPTRYEEYLAKGRPLPRETVGYLKKLTPMIDGTVHIPSRSSRPSDRRSAVSSPIFAPAGSSRSVDPVHADRESGVRTDTLFTAPSSSDSSLPVGNTVTGMTAIEPPPDVASQDARTTPEPASSRLFVQRSSGSAP